MITIGEMDTPVVLEKPSFSANANYGGTGSQTWSAIDPEIASVWSYMFYRGGNEKDEGEQQVGVQKVDFFIRYETYKDTIQPTWRIKHTLSSTDNVYFYIESIAHIDGRHKITKVTTTMKDNNPVV